MIKKLGRLMMRWIRKRLEKDLKIILTKKVAFCFFMNIMVSFENEYDLF